MRSELSTPRHQMCGAKLCAEFTCRFWPFSSNKNVRSHQTRRHHLAKLFIATRLAYLTQLLKCRVRSVGVTLFPILVASYPHSTLRTTCHDSIPFSSIKMAGKRPSVPRNREPCDPPKRDSTNSFWHSEPSALLTGHRATRDLPSTADVVVIGSGVTGTSVAHHLLTSANGGTEKGPNVVLLEAREACWGATGRVRSFAALCLHSHKILM